MDTRSEQLDYSISEVLRTAVWNEMYDNERISRYYQELLKKRKVADRILKGITSILAVSIAFLYLVEINMVLTVLSCLGFLCGYFGDLAFNSAKVRVLTQASKGCVTAESMLQELWMDIESRSIDDRSVKFRLSQINKLMNAMVTSPVLEAKFTEDRKLNEKCAQEAVENMIDLYKGATIDSA